PVAPDRLLGDAQPVGARFLDLAEVRAVARVGRAGAARAGVRGPPGQLAQERLERAPRVPPELVAALLRDVEVRDVDVDELRARGPERVVAGREVAVARPDAEHEVGALDHPGAGGRAGRSGGEEVQG